MNQWRLLAASVYLILTVPAVHAEVPTLINYQGQMQDGTGLPLDTTVSIAFRLYADESGTSLLWSETHTVVVVEGGLFHVLLGSTVPLHGALFNGLQRWLGMSIDGGPVSDPLLPMVSVPYAFSAIKADTADFALNTLGGSGSWSLSGQMLLTADYWGIGRGNAENQYHGDSVHTHVNLGGGSTTGLAGFDYAYATVGGGRQTRARHNYATVGGGEANLATGEHATIAGGRYNEAHGTRSTVAGGNGNIANGTASVVAGGGANTAAGENAAVLGGWDNDADGSRAVVSGGSWNQASGDYSAIAGGLYNRAAAYAAFVGGGRRDTVSASYAVVAGGENNAVHGTHSAILGGHDNRVTGIGSSIGGGSHNLIDGDYSAVIGGSGDTIATGTEYSYLLGLGSRLTMDSTVMLDMPHVMIGSEADGYELPTVDGSVGQVLTTDGAGIVNWTSVTGGSGLWSLSGPVMLSNDYWGLSRGNTGAQLHGDSARTMVNFGVGGITGTSGANYYYSTVGGGWSTRATHNFSTVAGGDRCQANGQHSTVGGGRANVANGERATVAGGNGNSAGGSSSTICGGGANTANGNDAVVGGGWDNDANGWRSFIGGGSWNKTEDDFAVVTGGQHNVALGVLSHVGGGSDDTASGAYSVIAGGYKNYAAGWSATVGGGHLNHVTGTASMIGGGEGNLVASNYAVIPGGHCDTILAGADFSYLFGIGSRLTQDSTFMVDLPYIRFGDEATGYVFPSTDGATSQVLATDGTGHLSWVDQSGSGGGGDGGWTDDGTTVRLTTGTDGVGIGTTSPGAKLGVLATGGKAISGQASASTGTVHAVYGEVTDIHAAATIGIEGRQVNTGNFGRLGTEMHGVSGLSTTGMAGIGNFGAGVRGENSGGGYGVHAIGAQSYGLYAETDAVNSAAVHGRRNGLLSWGQLGTDSAGAYGYFDSKFGRLGGYTSGAYAYGHDVYGVLAEAPVDTGVGIYAKGGPNGYAAVFRGNILILSQSDSSRIVELGEGLDYAEGFDVADQSGIEPGTVLSIDADNPGQLRKCDEAYDHKVAGIAAGANGLGSGVRLGAGKYDCDVALAGRVYCCVEAGHEPIAPGDLLTTSNTPGYAMKASDHERAGGAVLGKAMEPLPAGERGKILVLVTLQ